MKTSTLFFVLCCLALASADFMSALLKCHNDHRKKHGVSALTHNPTISTSAQKWAEELAKNVHFGHSTSSYGENIYWQWSSAGTPEPEALAISACNNWYSEQEVYDYDNPGYNFKTGHFTAIVWKSTTEVGAGYAFAADGGAYVVANYNPAGNHNNTESFRNNVLKPQ